MKVISLVVFILAYIAITTSYPATTDSKEENTSTPLDSSEVSFGADVFSSPFGDLFRSIEGVMSGLRQQINELLKNVPYGNNTDTDFTHFGFPNVDLGKGNTTSVVKVIDGHKVVINETEYQDTNENGGAFFKVRIIDVKPDSAETTTDTSGSTERDREPIDDSFENEIPKKQEVEDLDAVNPNKKDWSKLEALEDFDDNSIDHAPIDLHDDILINQLMADRGEPINPDAEIFDPELMAANQRGHHMQPFEKLVRRSNE